MADNGKVELKATRSISVTSVRSGTIGRDEKFSVSQAEAKSLIDRGLATKVGGAKAAAKPKNKAALKAKNKAR